jgi:hypothetical protein
MGRSLACKSLFKQGQMCVTFVMSYENFLGKFLKLLKEVVIMGYVYDLSDIDV